MGSSKSGGSRFMPKPQFAYIRSSIFNEIKSLVLLFHRSHRFLIRLILQSHGLTPMFFLFGSFRAWFVVFGFFPDVIPAIWHVMVLDTFCTFFLRQMVIFLSLAQFLEVLLLRCLPYSVSPLLGLSLYLTKVLATSHTASKYHTTSLRRLWW